MNSDEPDVTPILSEATRRDIEIQADAPDREILPDGGPSVIEVDGVETWVDPDRLEACERAGAEVREE